MPDFGFDDTLNTSTSHLGVWDLLYDNIRLFPKYERIKNIILEKEQEKKEYWEQLDQYEDRLCTINTS